MLWWRCHRNKCSFRGMHGAKVDRGSAPAVHTKGRWNYEATPLPKAWLEWLSNKFNIPDDIIDKEWQWTDGYGGRVVMPVRNHRNITTAYTLRSYDPEQGRKALIHRVMEETGQAWYQSCPYPSHVIIVEDQPSALRASLWTGVNTVALLGTHIPEDLLDRIKWAYNYIPVVLVALDQDATPEAAKYVVALRALYPRLRLWALQKDIKNMSEVEFYNTLTKMKEVE